MEMLPKAEVAPEVTFSTIAERLSELKPVTSISPKAAVAPPVMLSIAAPSEFTSKPVISSRESTAPAVILSNAPPTSEEEIPAEPRDPTTVPTNSLDAAPISEALKPASSNLETEVEALEHDAPKTTAKEFWEAYDSCRVNPYKLEWQLLSEELAIRIFEATNEQSEEVN